MGRDREEREMEGRAREVGGGVEGGKMAREGGGIAA